MHISHLECSLGYEEEPREHFQPLPEELSGRLYDICSSTTTGDAEFFATHLHRHGCRSLIELGCGTGRISAFLAGRGYRVVGIDTCRPLLAHPRHRPYPVVAMDMRAVGFTRAFEAAIIGCNTLNLLPTKEQIGLCLTQIAELLRGPALLLVQLFVPDRLLVQKPGTGFFQAGVHDMDDGGKLVREVIRTYRPARSELLLTERYKLRYARTPDKNINYHQQQKLSAFSPQTWFTLLADAGFTVLSHHGDTAATPFSAGDCSTLYIAAQAAAFTKQTDTWKQP